MATNKPTGAMPSKPVPTRSAAKDHSNVAPIYKPAASPAPTPTSLNQLKNTIGTLMNVKAEDEGTKNDPNYYKGEYGGKTWSWNQGKATPSK